MNSNKIKILIVTDVFPFPPNKNGNTENIYNIILQLKRNYSYTIDFIFIGRKKTISQQQILELNKIIDNLYIKNLCNTKLIRLSKWLYKKNFGIHKNYSVILFATFLSSYARFNFNIKARYILYQADSRTLHYSKLKGIINYLRYVKFKVEQKFMFVRFNPVS